MREEARGEARAEERRVAPLLLRLQSWSTTRVRTGHRTGFVAACAMSRGFFGERKSHLEERARKAACSCAVC